MDIAEENCAVNMSIEYFCNFLGFSLFITTASTTRATKSCQKKEELKGELILAAKM